MKKFQGEDIYFTLNFTTSAGSDITSFNDLANVIVYAYTKEDNIVKFSRETKVGYSTLTPVGTDGMVLKGVITSANTKLMLGQMILDIMCIKTNTDGDGTENMIQTSMSGVFIMESLIKDEA